MEKENITLDPRSSFTPSSSADIPVPPDGLVQRSTRIKRIQTTAMLLLFFAAVINYSRPQFAVGSKFNDS